MTHDGQDATMSSAEDETKEYPCLVRVTNGKELNFSTKVRSQYSNVKRFSDPSALNQVEPGQLDAFHAKYGALLKPSMSTMRKRDKKREKQKTELVARKKRRLAEDVVVEGPKRGNGRRKRQRLLKAALRQNEARQRAQEREAARTSKPTSR